MDSSPEGLLATYLNDHLAGSTTGEELARRTRDANDGSELGVLLGSLTAEVEEDVATLKSVMDAVGAGRDRAKMAAAWVGEKAGRLKPNDQLTGYSPLSRLIELEGLSMGIEGKRLLWVSLDQLTDPRLAAFDFGQLAERAARQRTELEPFRLAAAQTAFGRDVPAVP
ncbi:MAG: hypothetical protein ACR2J6_05115 [Thermoleophilaceae bacterium]